MGAAGQVCTSCATPITPDAAFCPTCGAPTPTQRSSAIHRDFQQHLTAVLADRYRVERELGRGGMAIVYLAEDLKHRRKVALKVLRPELAASVGADRFLREIDVAARLSHPNILALHDSGEADRFLYFVMPYVDGESLRHKLNREGQLAVDDALRLGMEIADGLDHAHEQGVIHRDIKPENILLSRGHALIADFGIAKAVAKPGAEHLTSTGASIGTPHYMSPEQATGDTRIDRRTDVYSLACVVYEMLSGEPPFTGPSAQAVMAKHAVEARPGVRTLRETVSVEVEGTIRRAMAKSPADRFPTAGAFATALTRPDRGAAWLSARTVRRGVIAAVVLAATALGVVGVREWRGPPGPDLNAGAVDILDPNRIAVLYFEDLSDDGSLGHVARGLTEDLIRELSWVDGLHVTSPEGVRPFRDASPPIDSIARALAVGSIVGGSVAQSGDQLRVRVRLLDPATAEELVSRAFQDGMNGVFVLQDRMADEVARFLRERLGREVQLRRWRARAATAAAWELLNRAEETADEAYRLLRDSRTVEARAMFNTADSLAGRASALEPDWAEPVLSRARTAYGMAIVDEAGQLLSAEWLRRALAHVDTVLRRDSTSADALALRGELRYRLAAWTSEDTDEQLLIHAEADLRRALDLEPRLAGAWYALGDLQFDASRYAEAQVALATAYRTDAYLTEAPTVVQLLFFSSLEVEDFEEASRWCDIGRHRFPDDPRFVDCEITLLGWSGRGTQHIQRAREVLAEITRVDSLGALGPKPAYARMWIAALYARTGMAAEARAFIDSAQRVASAFGPAADVRHVEAYVRLLLGQRDAAFRALSAYLSQYPGSRTYLARSPWFKSVRSDAEFAALLAGSE